MSSWSDGQSRRIFLGDIEDRLWAIDAATGQPVPDFGETGKVDMRAGMGFPKAQYGLTSSVTSWATEALGARWPQHRSALVSE